MRRHTDPIGAHAVNAYNDSFYDNCGANEIAGSLLAFDYPECIILSGQDQSASSAAQHS